MKLYMKYNINDIFHSIQGEGHNCGMPAIFIRFVGCNLHCSYCDEKFNKINYEMSVREIFDYIQKYNSRNIILTGGEPTLQINSLFINYFLNQKYNIYMETNGMREFSYDAIWVTVSPKKVDYRKREGNELKIVYNGQTEYELNEYCENSCFKFYYLQPESNKEQYIKKAIKIIKNSNYWRLSLQCQKLINIK